MYWVFIYVLKYFYWPQRSCGQGNVFTGVCLSTGGVGGGCLPQCMLGYQTPPDQADPLNQADPPRPGRPTPWDQADTPPDQADTSLTRQTPPQTRHPPTQTRHPQPPTPPRPGRPPPGSRLQHTVYEQPVRILLEAFLFLIETNAKM